MSLHDRIRRFITSGEGDFEALALEVFAHQYATLEVVRRLADRQERPPARVSRWQDIPAVPSVAFKHLSIFSGKAVAHTFGSSGTSGAARSQSHFSEAGLELMDASIVANARRYLFGDGERSRIVVLAPSPEMAPPMIMAWGMDRLITHFGLEGSGFLVGPDGLDVPRLLSALRESAESSTPVTLIGASFGFVHLLDGLKAKGIRLPAAPASRMMDAGGFKGRSREVTRAALYGGVETHLGIPAERCVNLLGMTELASQFYDSILAEPTSPRRKRNAPWTRSRVLDPLTMAPAEPGKNGLLVHLDLANLERPMVVQTDDLGTADADGWEVLGRAAGADAKGCSLTLEDLLGG